MTTTTIRSSNNNNNNSNNNKHNKQDAPSTRRREEEESSFLEDDKNNNDDDDSGNNNARRHPAILPIPDKATWNLIRETYRKVKSENGGLDDWDKALLTFFAESDAAAADDAADATTDTDNVDIHYQPPGFHVPIVVKPSPGKGRGVFAVDFIPKDTCIVEDCSGHFVTEQQWRTFLQTLPTKELARDAVSWAYVCEYDSSTGNDNDKDELQDAVWLDLFEGSLINHGDTESTMTMILSFLKQLVCCCHQTDSNSNNNNDKANLSAARFHHGKWHMHASRDIQAGEELLCDYHEFHDNEHSLRWFDDTWREYLPDQDGAHEF